MDCSSSGLPLAGGSLVDEPPALPLSSMMRWAFSSALLNCESSGAPEG